MSTSTLDPPTRRLHFDLPAALEADAPPESRGSSRDDVRLLVSVGTRAPLHGRFADLPLHLDAGDLLVVNTTATIAASIDARTAGDEPVEVHVSTRLPTGLWLVELREPAVGASRPRFTDAAGETLRLDGGATVQVLTRFRGSRRLWVATIDAHGSRVIDHLARFGRAIRYRHVRRDWPIEAYQTVFAHDPGSAEMPSASRAFTPAIVTELVSRGVAITPVTLHTGVSSLESDEQPYPEWFSVPPETATRVNATRRAGGRVVAAGTTVVRALESAVDDRGDAQAHTGWTDLVITPERGVRVVDGLLTGWHEPEASHLLMLEAVAGHDALALAYREAVAERYLWHEFGDTHLILPDRRLRPGAGRPGVLG